MYKISCKINAYFYIIYKISKFSPAFMLIFTGGKFDCGWAKIWEEAGFR
jgi:hypothetical protein